MTLHELGVVLNLRLVYTTSKTGSGKKYVSCKFANTFVSGNRMNPMIQTGVGASRRTARKDYARLLRTQGEIGISDKRLSGPGRLYDIPRTLAA